MAQVCMALSVSPPARQLSQRESQGGVVLRLDSDIPLPLLKGEVAARRADGEIFILRLREAVKPSQSRLRLDSSP